MVAGELTGVASVRNYQKLPLCLTKPEPAGSEMNALLAKPGPIRNGGKVCLIIDFKKEKFIVQI